MRGKGFLEAQHQVAQNARLCHVLTSFPLWHIRSTLAPASPRLLPAFSCDASCRGCGTITALKPALRAPCASAATA